jgi:DNA-binding NarL/FixJ family response regulator
MIRVVIADDHHLVRQGIRALLEKSPEIRIVGEAADGQEAIDICTETRPDVLVIDIVMPRLNGIQTVDRLRRSGLPTKAIVLSMYSDKTLVREVLTQGAKGYVLKQAVAEELLLAIQAAVRNETYLSPSISSILVETALFNRQSGVTQDGFESLSPREREVLQLLAEGHTNGEVAQILVLSEKTIEKHRATVMEKLDIHNLAGLVRVAIRHGLISLSE